MDKFILYSILKVFIHFISINEKQPILGRFGYQAHLQDNFK